VSLPYAVAQKLPLARGPARRRRWSGGEAVDELAGTTADPVDYEVRPPAPPCPPVRPSACRRGSCSGCAVGGEGEGEGWGWRGEGGSA
jgi:hypothetical protein